MAKREKPWKAEYAKTGRSRCRTCDDFIAKDLLRLGLIVDASRFDGLMTEWHHVDCLFKNEGQIETVDDVEGLDLLRWDDQQKIKLYINKRNKYPFGHGFFLRLLGLLFPGGAQRGEKVDQPADSISSAALEEQNKAVWVLKDELKKHVNTREMREMLEANNHYSKGSENDLRESCADGMLFGALGRCSVCRGNSLRYVGGRYICHGHVSDHTSCSYSTRDPLRLQEKWRIPPGTNNNYLLEWFDSQEAEKPVRLLPPPPAESAVYDEESLQNLKAAIAGNPSDVTDGLKKKLVAAGVKFHTRIKKDTSCLVWNGKMDDDNSEIKSARRLKIPIVHLVYLQECLLMQKKLSFGPYIVDAASPYVEMVPVVSKEVAAVHEASGLRDTGHILTDGEVIYSTTLIKSDIARGVNSYYILQIIQENEDPDCYLFRKWGRTGHDTIGDSMKEKMSMSVAILQFKKLFKRQTGNTWESWNPNDDDFEGRRGKYFPVNIDHAVGFVPGFELEGSCSQLPPKVKELMELICNEQIFRANSMKAELDMDELPLGKLSKVSIAKGLEILDKIYDLLWNGLANPAKENSILDLSNNYYNVIPSTHPRPISDKEDLRAKSEMLRDLLYTERLMEISGISMEVDASVDKNYKLLLYDLKHLPPDSDDYKLIEKYFSNSKSPLHNEWDLNLEEVFEINRKDETEEEHASSSFDALHSKMLLWHGDRLRNVIGILGQGLTIAPERDPAVGKFGRGLYFADLVSASAQLCFVKDSSTFDTKKKEGYAILFLAEVALGDVYELMQYQNINELPEGKHSVKGVGWVTPSEKGHVMWRGQVKVPCGRKPTLSRIKTQLNCNEYVVYDIAQVKLRFLVKVRFRTKEAIMGAQPLYNMWIYMRNGLVR